MDGWSDHMMGCRFFDGAIPGALCRWYHREQAKTDPDVLLIHPDSSPFIPVELMAEFQRGVPDGRLHVIGRARHGMPVSDAAICAALLRDFLAEVA